MSIRLGLVKGIREEQEQQQKQQELHEKYSIEEDVRIVEKTNMGKFLVRTIVSFMRLVFHIILVSLAFVGLAAIIYPVPRYALFEIGLNAFHEIMSLFG